MPEFIELDDTQLAELDEAEQADYEQAKSEHEESKIAEQDKEKQKALTAQGLINSYQKKIDNGEITIDEAPKWMSNDLKPKEKVADEISLKEKVKAELLDEMEYEKLYSTIPDDIEAEQADKMDEIIEAEMKLGKTKTQALKYAMFEVGVEKPTTQYQSFPRIRNKLEAKKKTDPTEDYYMNTLPKAYK